MVRRAPGADGNALEVARPPARPSGPPLTGTRKPITASSAPTSPTRRSIDTRTLRADGDALETGRPPAGAGCAAVTRYPQTIQAELLPDFADALVDRYPYGARAEAAVYVGDLLTEEVPALRDGQLEIVALARRPGVLSKVAIRPPAGQPLPLGGVGIGADHVARVRDRLDGERIDVVAWQRTAAPFIAGALGLGEIPPIVLLPALARARVLLGEIDVRGIGGWRGLNTVLASALTGWRIRLEPVAATAAWRRLERALQTRRAVPGTVVGETERGLRLDVLGLYAVLPGGQGRVGQDLVVRITRLDPDEGRIFVSDRLAATGQLALI